MKVSMRIFFVCLAVSFLATGLYALIGTPVCPFEETKKEYNAPETRKVKPEWHLIDKAVYLPHKCQEETQERIDELNSLSTHEPYVFDPAPNTPPYNCLSYAASTVCDWWTLMSEGQLPTYENFYNKKIETGFNPRPIEVVYINRSRFGLLTYGKIRFKDRCPITKDPIMIRPSGYARILTGKDTMEYIDPVDPSKKYVFDRDSFPMDYKYKVVFNHNNLKNLDPMIVVDALEKWGIGITQFEMHGQEYLMGTHSTAVVGWGTVDGKIQFLCHDSFGDYDYDYVQDQHGAPRYRYVNIDEMDEFIVFPHKLNIRVKIHEDMFYMIEVTDRSGTPQSVILTVSYPEYPEVGFKIRSRTGIYMVIPEIPDMMGEPLRIEVEKRHFYTPEGKNHSILFKP